MNLQDVQKDSNIGPAGRDLGHHSALGIPILLDEQAIGVIWFVCYKKRRFNEKEVKLLSSLGNLIAVAIAKIKKTEELKERNRNLLILSEISQAVHQSIDLNQTYKTVLEVAEDLDYVDLISVYLTEGKSSEKEAVLQVQGGSTVNRFKLPKRIPCPEEILGEAVKTSDLGYYENAVHLTFLKEMARRFPEQQYPKLFVLETNLWPSLLKMHKVRTQWKLSGS
ncbi:MAG: GAF domain-containing protein [Deltaproteobacteria bacterium]|nr:GAF domain-containing protein [Deltaproteobacteria bacterium]